MTPISDVEIGDILFHVYWTGFDDGRLLGKEKSPTMKHHRRAHRLVDNAKKKVRALIKKAKS